MTQMQPHRACSAHHVADDRTTQRSLRLFLMSAFVLVLGIWSSACGPKYPACGEDADCKQAEFCLNQLCQQCRNDADCGDGKQCSAGACEDIPGFCRTAKDCAAGQECVASRCHADEVAQTPPEGAKACQLKPIYFAFDSVTLEPSARDGVASNVQCARERSIERLKITGYTDPRGTEEYNLALGSRRASSVEEYVRSLGLAEQAVSSTSMGEEMASGNEEAGWSQDRRVEFANP